MRFKLSPFLLLIFTFLYYAVLTQVALYCFQSGIYSDEVNTIGFDNGSADFYLFYLAISVAAFFVFWRFIPKIGKNFDFDLRHRDAVAVVSMLLLCYFSVPLAIYGPALFSGMNRYAYQELPLVTIFNLKLFLALFSFVWGAFHTQYGKSTKKFLFFYLSYLFICVLYGEKASGIVDSFFYFFTGYFLYRKTPMKLSVVLSIAATVIIIPLLIYSMQLLIIGLSMDQVLIAFFTRLGRQGQVFWSVYGSEVFRASQDNIAWDQFNYFREGYSGMKLLMYSVMPPDKFAAHTGSLAAGYPAILFYTTHSALHLIGIIAAMSFIYIIPMYFYFFVLLRYKYFFVILPFFVFALTVHLKIFQSGNIFLMTNPKYVIFYIGTVILLLFFFLARMRRALP